MQNIKEQNSPASQPCLYAVLQYDGAQLSTLEHGLQFHIIPVLINSQIPFPV